MYVIHDCFPFWRETVMVDTRMMLCDERWTVYRAYLGDRTHRGGPISHGPLPASVRARMVTLDADSDWGRERQQRDAVWFDRHEMRPDDLVFLCDADEIVNPEAFDAIYEATERGPVALSMALYYYGTTWRDPAPWLHAKACRAKHLTPTVSADLRLNLVLPAVPNAGWHLAWQGDAVWTDQKLSSFAHAEFDSDEGREALRRGRAEGVDPHGRKLIHDPLTGPIAEAYECSRS